MGSYIRKAGFGKGAAPQTGPDSFRVQISVPARILFMKNDLLKNSDERATRFIANALLICTAFLIFTAVLNALGVFILDKTAFAAVTAVCSVIMCIPKIIFLIRKKYEDWMKYVVLACITISVSVAYSVLTFHVVMAFVFPLVISLMYFDRKLIMFISALTVVFMTLAHILSSVTSVVFDDPLDTLGKILIFGLVPRLLLFCFIAIICVALGKKAQKLFAQLQEYNEEIELSKESLDTIMGASRDLYNLNDLEELAGLIRIAVCNVTTSILGDSCTPVATVGICGENGSFRAVSSGDSGGRDIIGEIGVESFLSGVSFYYPLKKELGQDKIQICENGVGMSFYNEDKLILYVSMELLIDNNMELLKKNLSVLYNNINTAVKRTMLNENMFRTQESVILSFAEISESKSHQTGQHVKRVSEYTRIMAACDGYGESQCSEIALAAMMHDIGKLMIPPEILEKPGKLTPEEFAVIKTHVTYGSELLKNSPGEVMSMARKITLQHHERWDGNGYLGYRGEEIDYISTFVTVADVFDALVSKRSYKEGWPPEEAYAEIISQKGKQFAPHAVDIFIKSYDKILETLKRYPDEAAQAI